ncbi:MAG: bifunctional metallophosphatase/5'-nucleotidase [Devosia nanyangense]|uniref:Bifunctional metallophosphatase/5'-nucleotidase n=1 Tax=Devosia nanyangense TaxID=1228055 RepID=A0A933KY50_9HYPH|nr:bifunctional metallophosphatase/5'-nucleotidase [Devosia nanyangense]
MKSIITRLAAAALLGIAASTAIAVPALAEDVKITVLGVGDIYAFDGGKVRGGFARLNAAAKAEKAANPNTLYVHDGDMISPSLLSGLDYGANTIELTNVVPFDLAVPGNHEFDFGPEVFMQRVGESKYPWAAINIAGPDGKPVAGLGFETVMKEFSGVKVALVPIGEDETPVLATTKDWQFTPGVATGLDAAQKAREAGADIVIAVTHTDHDADYALQASHKFDLIVSGHDHDYRTGYDGITAYVETSTEANFLTAVDLNVTVTPAEGDKKRTVTWTPTFRFIDTATVTADADTQAVVDKLKAKLGTELDVEIGTSAGALDSRRATVRGEESTWGDLIADAMVAQSGADVALTNGGGIRGDKEYPAGTVLTRKDVFTELPFGNKTVVVELSGADLLAALENGFSQVEAGAGRFPQVSGLTVEADATKAPGARVVTVTVGGKPLDPAATYKVATNDYMLGGGDGYTAFGKGKVLIDASAAHLMASDVIDYITAKKTLDVKVDGRITLKK